MVLQNKLGITNSVELAREEERISKKKALELFDTTVLEKYPVGSFAQLAAIHRYLFEGIYDFAGNGGYQLGKITVDPQGIYIIGYINMTTNALPSVLKNDWIEKIKAL